jgi:hypothetical protein
MVARKAVSLKSFGSPVSCVISKEAHLGVRLEMASWRSLVAAMYRSLVLWVSVGVPLIGNGGSLCDFLVHTRREFRLGIVVRILLDVHCVRSVSLVWSRLSRSSAEQMMSGTVHSPCPRDCRHIIIEGRYLTQPHNDFPSRPAPIPINGQPVLCRNRAGESWPAFNRWFIHLPHKVWDNISPRFTNYSSLTQSMPINSNLQFLEELALICIVRSKHGFLSRTN